MRKQLPPIAVTGALLATVAVVAILQHKPTLAARLTPGQVAEIDRTKIDAAYTTPKAKQAYSDFVDRWKASPDKQVQDQVGAARIRLAYLTTKDKDWEKARTMFKDAAAQYKGTGDMRSDFGGIKDQALYQAAVCLNAEGKKDEYRAALVDFIKTEPESPLVSAVYKRIVKVDGKATAETDALLQSALDKQAKRIRFETSVCGPKAAVYILKLEGKGDFDYKALAKECGTTDDGTSIEGLRKGLKAHGLDYFGYRVGKADLGKIECPAILFKGDHYVVVTKASTIQLDIFDPSRDKEDKLPITKITDPKFNAIFLLKSPPKGLQG